MASSTALRTSMARHRKILFGSVMFLIVAATIELMAQAAYFVTSGSFLFQRVSVPIYEPDPHRCFALRPDLEYEHRTHEFSHMIYTNSQGFRTDARRREYQAEKPPGTVRLLFLGPSFTFGWASDYEDIYATRAGRMLEESGLTVEVLNAGVPSQGVLHQQCWLQEEGYRYHPDVIVQTVYGKSVPAISSGCPEELDCPVVEDGVLYSEPPTLARRVIATAKSFATVFYAYYAYQALTSNWAEEGTGKELHQDARKTGTSPRELVAAYRNYIHSVKELLGDDTEVVFVYFPLSYVVHPEDAPRWSHIGSPDPWGARARIADAAKVLRSNGIPFVDASPALIEQAKSHRLYHWLDIHFTEAGNRVVAKVLTQALRSAVARILSRQDPQDAGDAEPASQAGSQGIRSSGG